MKSDVRQSNIFAHVETLSIEHLFGDKASKNPYNTNYVEPFVKDFFSPFSLLGFSVFEVFSSLYCRFVLVCVRFSCQIVLVNIEHEKESCVFMNGAQNFIDLSKFLPHKKGREELVTRPVDKSDESEEFNWSLPFKIHPDD
jgi:hypothetical protein